MVWLTLYTKGKTSGYVENGGFLTTVDVKEEDYDYILQFFEYDENQDLILTPFFVDQYHQNEDLFLIKNLITKPFQIGKYNLIKLFLDSYPKNNDESDTDN